MQTFHPIGFVKERMTEAVRRPYYYNQTLINLIISVSYNSSV